MREIKFRAWNETTKKIMDWEELKEDMTETLHVFENGLADVPPVMQYIGLKDKNNVEIYEGDIIKQAKELGWFRTEVVEFKVKEYCPFWINQNTVEVIGNIYENPELLEKKNEKTT